MQRTVDVNTVPKNNHRRQPCSCVAMDRIQLWTREACIIPQTEYHSKSRISGAIIIDVIEATYSTRNSAAQNETYCTWLLATKSANWEDRALWSKLSLSRYLVRTIASSPASAKQARAMHSSVVIVLRSSCASRPSGRPRRSSLTCCVVARRASKLMTAREKGFEDESHRCFANERDRKYFVWVGFVRCLATCFWKCALKSSEFSIRLVMLDFPKMNFCVTDCRKTSLSHVREMILLGFQVSCTCAHSDDLKANPLQIRPEECDRNHRFIAEDIPWPFSTNQ